MLFVIATIAIVITVVVLIKKYTNGELPMVMGTIFLGIIALVVVGGVTIVLTNLFPSETAYAEKTEQDILSVEETTKLVSAGKSSYYVDAVIITTPNGETDKIRTSDIRWIESDDNVFITEVTTAKNPFLFPISTDTTDYTVYGVFE